MAAQTVDFYSIRTLTNLHAGSGDIAYGIVDNMVQRDPASEIPVIHASSLKGALRQHFTEVLGKTKAENGKERDHPDVIKIFGGETSPRNKGASGDDFSAGSHLFFEAKLLVLPVRSDRRPFFRAVSPAMVREITALWKNLGFEPDEHLKDAFDFIASQKIVAGKPQVLTNSGLQKDFCIEEWEFSADVPKVVDNDKERLTKAEIVFGENLVCLHSVDFKMLCKKIPVIARNQLENGISKNLFYEEVVPRESRFFSFIVRPEGDASFVTRLKNNPRVQVGANATIGYGQCQFHRYASEPKL